MRLILQILVFYRFHESVFTFKVQCNPEIHYLCSGGLTCIYKNYVCDGIADCENKDDEQNCGELITFRYSHESPET